MSELIVSRFKIVTVRRGEDSWDEMRGSPNGEFCRYKEADLAHQSALTEYRGNDVNIELLKALETIANAEEIDGETIVCDFSTLQSIARGAIRKVVDGDL